MPNSPLVAVVSTGVVALALVGHLWMLSGHGSTGLGPDSQVAAVALAETIAGPEQPTALSGCPMGMSACQVPMPTDPLAAVLALAFMGVVLMLDTMLRDVAAGRAPSERVASERAPPRRPAVPSSVVLLV